MFTEIIHNWNLVFHLSDKIKDQKRTVFMKKEIEMEKAGFFKKMKKGWQGNSVNCLYPDNK